MISLALLWVACSLFVGVVTIPDRPAFCSVRRHLVYCAGTVGAILLVVAGIVWLLPKGGS